MTIETRATIQLGDILAVEYECLGCHAKVVRPLAHPAKNGESSPHVVPRACGNCGAVWVLEHSSAAKDLAMLFNLIAIYGGSECKLPFALRVEFRGLEQLALARRATNTEVVP